MYGDSLTSSIACDPKVRAAAQEESAEEEERERKRKVSVALKAIEALRNESLRRRVRKAVVNSDVVGVAIADFVGKGGDASGGESLEKLLELEEVARALSEIGKEGVLESETEALEGKEKAVYNEIVAQSILDNREKRDRGRNKLQVPPVEEFQRLLNQSLELRELGREYFCQENYASSTVAFRDAYQIVDSLASACDDSSTSARKGRLEETLREECSLMLLLHASNLAASLLREQNNYECIQICTRVLNYTFAGLQKGGDLKVKLCYRRGMAFLRRKKWDDAITDFESVLSVEPWNVEASSKLVQARHGKKQELAKESEFAKNALKG